jgi:hypothetical protein
MNTNELLMATYPAPVSGFDCNPVSVHIPVPKVIPRPMNNKSKGPKALRKLPRSWACRERRSWKGRVAVMF